MQLPPVTKSRGPASATAPSSFCFDAKSWDTPDSSPLRRVPHPGNGPCRERAPPSPARLTAAIHATRHLGAMQIYQSVSQSQAVHPGRTHRQDDLCTLARSSKYVKHDTDPRPLALTKARGGRGAKGGGEGGQGRGRGAMD